MFLNIYIRDHRLGMALRPEKCSGEERTFTSFGLLLHFCILYNERTCYGNVSSLVWRLTKRRGSQWFGKNTAYIFWTLKENIGPHLWPYTGVPDPLIWWRNRLLSSPPSPRILHVEVLQSFESLSRFTTAPGNISVDFFATSPSNFQVLGAVFKESRSILYLSVLTYVFVSA